MKILKQDPSKLVTLQQINAGEIFELNDNTYMKLSEDQIAHNAVNLKTGRLSGLHERYLVIPLQAELSVTY